MHQSRIKRVSILLQRLIATIIQRDLQDPRLKNFLSITHVDVSKDLSYANIYISMLNNDLTIHEQTINVLNRASGFIRKALFKNVEFKTVPQLRFYIDHSIANAQALTYLINQVPGSSE